MDISNLLTKLNNKQREAVSAPRCNLLVLAGAGSGKTRVLVYRIAWLLSVENCLPYSIMAVTFTNKAAIEMRHRIKNLIGDTQDGMWIGTFHGLAHLLLRTHYMEANLPKNFQILDNDDQLQLLKRIVKELNIDEDQWLPRQAMYYINSKKDEGLRPQHVEIKRHSSENILLSIYLAYQEACDRAGLLDFSELLIRAKELWLNQPHILKYYRDRFTNLLVDEFQDTNSIQYDWIRLLTGKNNNVMIVGDDDQSIYGWRGAQVKNIQRFLSDFLGARTLRLEQNYRSTRNILEAANSLISYNDQRMGKKLWTDGGNGEPISIYCAYNEIDEARFVINRIKTWHGNGGALNDCAILYRSHAQSRVLEEALLQASTPYRIYGGQRFFERQEIKDALAYLRLISNRNDDAAFERVINRPTRGIGRCTLNIVRQVARDRQLTLWHSMHELLKKKSLGVSSASSLQRFSELVDSLAYKTAKMPLHMQTNQVIRDSGLFLMYQKEKSEKSRSRIENLKELVTATQQYSSQLENQNPLSLQLFLSHVALEVSEERTDSYCQETVQLMTLHSAKGLEFPLVFIIGMEEGIFPSKMSLYEGGRLQEERRLAYVGLTRAMQKLTLTYTEKRRLYGKEVYHKPSRFISELPLHCVVKIQSQTSALRPINHDNVQAKLSENDTGYKLGECVQHPTFGKGVIVNLEGSNEHSRLKINFYKVGVKWLVVAYAKLKRI